jgi:hypothetical protein
MGMSIEQGKQALRDLATEVGTFAQQGIELTQEEQFASLPGRFTEIAELATRLEVLIKDASNDANDYVVRAGLFCEGISFPNTSETWLDMASKAASIIADPQTREEISGQIQAMGTPFNTLRTEADTEEIRQRIGSYRSRLRGLASFSKGWGSFFAAQNKNIPEEVTARNREVQARIGAAITGLEQQP